MNSSLFYKISILLGLLLSSLKANAAAPNVVITLKPIHALVANVMQGVAQPTLLLPDGASPHTFQLKPSTLKQLQQADIIIWVGPTLELFMSKPLKQHPPRLGLITISNIPKLMLLPLRQGREWHHDHEESEHDHVHQAGESDPHLWLSTYNAETISWYIAQFLAKHDPEHANQYLQNAKKLIAELIELRSQLKALLLPVKDQPFLVYHDGYQYFEKEFILNAQGSIMVNLNLPLSANGLNTIKKMIADQHIKCVFRETEFNDTQIQNNLKKTNVQVRELDPLGARLPLGPHLYSEILLTMGKTLAECLASNVPTNNANPTH